MFVLAHLGMGNALARLIRRDLDVPWLLVGTLLPDLIDKSLYYGLSWSTGRQGADLGLISCTRTFGHTGLLLVLLGVVAYRLKSRRGTALTIGAATHLFLDNLADLFGDPGFEEPTARLALLFPFYRTHFGIQTTHSLGEHLCSFLDPYTFITEAIGLCLLIWAFRRKRDGR